MLIKYKNINIKNGVNYLHRLLTPDMFNLKSNFVPYINYYTTKIILLF
uniref:Uncharacterized protein n=1 Tax=Myoviridae sp. ctNQV2 TaxID=2827683 RepID=A0A8S5RZ00_9CAUD|nr:MAG TPA: hypothetical protein [Myoviridae sp. ctNQV2]